MNNAADLFKNANLKVNRLSRVGIVFIVSMLLFIFFAILVKRHAYENMVENINYNNEIWVSTLSASLDKDITYLKSLSVIYSRPQDIDLQYQSVLNDLSSKFMGIQSVTWVPEVDNKLIPLHRWGDKEASAIFEDGADISNEFGSYISKAKDIASMVLSEQTLNYSDPSKIENRTLLLFIPVFDKWLTAEAPMVEKRENFKGVFVAQLNLGKYVHWLNVSSKFEDVDYIIYDTKGTRDQKVLYSKLTSYKENPNDIIWSYSKNHISSSIHFDVADRNWTLLALTTPKFESAHTSYIVYLILILGFIFSCALFSLVSYVQDKFLTMTQTLLEDKEKVQNSEQRLKFSEGQLKEKNRFLVDQKIKIEHKAQLLELNALKRAEFLSVIAHKLRSPINGIVVKSNVMLDYLKKNLDKNVDKITKKDAILLIETIEQNSLHVLKFLNDVLEVSLVEAHTTSLSHDAVVIKTFFEKLASYFAEELKNKELKINFEVEKQVPLHITADKRHLDRVLKTIISNAIAYTHSGSITLKAYVPSASFKYHDPNLKEKTLVAIEVKDTGVGLEKHKIDRLFKPLEGFISTSGTSNHLGLGLVLTREMVEMMGGELHISSEVGVGTTVTIFIPTS